MQSHRLQQTPRQWKAQGRGEGVFFFHRDQKASMRTNSGTKAAGSGQRRRRVLVCSGASPTDETRQKRPLQGAGHDIFGRADGRRGGGGGSYLVELICLHDGVSPGDGLSAGGLEVERAAVLLRVPVRPAEHLPASAPETRQPNPLPARRAPTRLHRRWRHCGRRRCRGRGL